MAPMASRKSRKAIQVEAPSPNESEEENAQPSQGQNSADIDIIKNAQELMSSSNQRREAKRRAIEAEYEKKKKDLADRILALIESRKSRVTKSQKSQWDRLEALNKRRSTLEAQIVASMRSIEQHSANISNEMCAMFGGRIEDIQETATPQTAKIK